MSVTQAIAAAEKVLPGTAAPEGAIDQRWQAIIGVGAFVRSDPDAVLEFACRWGRHADADLRMAVAMCLLEHLLEHHFEAVFPRIEEEVRRSGRFADTFLSCSSFGKTRESANAERFERLRRSLGAAGPRHSSG